MTVVWPSLATAVILSSPYLACSLIYTVGDKNETLLFFRLLRQILSDFLNFFTTIYNKELRNKNLLKFSPHLKSVLPHYLVKLEMLSVDMQQGHIQLKIDSTCQVTVLTLSSSQILKRLLIYHSKRKLNDLDYSIS